MVALAKKYDTQVEIEGLEDPNDEVAEIEAGVLWRAALWSAMRKFVASYIDISGQKGMDAAAAALDKRWGGDGRSVSASVLSAALRDSERNHFRLEWADWFAARSPEIADLLARRVKPDKTYQELYEDLCSEVRETSPKHAESIIRRARIR